MQRRVPAAGDADQIGLDKARRAGGFAIGQDTADLRAAHPPVAEHRGNRAAGLDGHAGAVRRLRQPGRRRFARIGQGHRDACLGQHPGGAVGRIVVRAQQSLLAGNHGVAPGIVADRVAEHRAGRVVVRKCVGPLVRAGRQHDLPGPDTPQPQTGQMRRRARPEALADILDGGREIVIVQAGDRRPAEHRNIRRSAQPLHCCGDPVHRRRIVDRAITGQQVAARLGLLVGQDHPATPVRRRQRGGQAGRPPADDQHIAMGVHALVAVRIGRRRRRAEAGGAADERLEQLPPAPGAEAAAHEGLVVETGREDRREPVVHPHQVEIDRRPGIDARRGQAAIKFDLGGTQVRLGVSAGLELDQRIRLFRAGAPDAARAMVFEAARQRKGAIGQQGGGQCVAGVAGEGLAVEGEGKQRIPVDPAAGRQAVLRPAHPPASGSTPPNTPVSPCW